jgi:gluconokinase
MPSATTKPAPAVSVVTSKTPQQSQSRCHHIWVVTGPAGSGKSTLARSLKNKLNWPYIEGDEVRRGCRRSRVGSLSTMGSHGHECITNTLVQFHPATNVEKMSNGIPLNDADRWDWLTVLREESLKRLNTGAEGVIVTCSALKKKYRDVIRVAPYYDASLMIHFIYLKVPETQVLERVTRRENHYMGADMVHSQFEVLEPPESDERDSFIIDATRPTDEVLDDALSRINAQRDL